MQRMCSKEDIKVVHKPINKLKNHFKKPKDPTPSEKKPGIVYSVPCKACTKEYVGLSKRTLKERINEHKRACDYGNINDSACAQHSIDEGHVIDFKGSKIIHFEPRFKQRQIKEAIEISRRENYNRDAGYPISPFYRPLLQNSKIPPQHLNSVFEHAKPLNLEKNWDLKFNFK